MANPVYKKSPRRTPEMSFADAAASAVAKASETVNNMSWFEVADAAASSMGKSINTGHRADRLPRGLNAGSPASLQRSGDPARCERSRWSGNPQRAGQPPRRDHVSRRGNAARHAERSDPPAFSPTKGFVRASAKRRLGRGGEQDRVIGQWKQFLDSAANSAKSLSEIRLAD